MYVYKVLCSNSDVEMRCRQHGMSVSCVPHVTYSHHHAMHTPTYTCTYPHPCIHIYHTTHIPSTPHTPPHYTHPILHIPHHTHLILPTHPPTPSHTTHTPPHHMQVLYVSSPVQSLLWPLICRLMLELSLLHPWEWGVRTLLHTHTHSHAHYPRTTLQ